MIDEIKQRIEQVKAGQTPEGYRRTKIGIVPNDWVKKQIGELFTFETGLPVSRNELSDIGICCLHYGDIHKRNKNYIDIKTEFETIPKLSLSPKKISEKILLNDGDIVFVDASEDYEGINKHVVIKNNDNIPFVSGLHTIVFKSKDESIFNKYKRFCFQNDMIKKQFSRYATGVSVYGISKTSIAKIIIFLPSFPEQKKIAEILATYDKVIELKERLIEEKKRRKKWLMQKLLNPESGVRLPGFAGKWENIKLKNLALIIMGQSPDSKFYNENKIGLPLIQGNADCVDRKVKPRFWTSKITRKCQANDIIFTVRAPVGAIAKSDFEACIGRGVCAIRPKNESEYLYHYLIMLENRWNRVSQGSTFDSISGEEIKNLVISIPKSINEQNAISEILSTADREIELLEKELEETKLQKKALMQLLLTGIVRVNDQLAMIKD